MRAVCVALVIVALGASAHAARTKAKIPAGSRGLNNAADSFRFLGAREEPLAAQPSQLAQEMQATISEAVSQVQNGGNPEEVMAQFDPLAAEEAEAAKEGRELSPEERGVLSAAQDALKTAIEAAAQEVEAARAQEEEMAEASEKAEDIKRRAMDKMMAAEAEKDSEKAQKLKEEAEELMAKAQRIEAEAGVPQTELERIAAKVQEAADKAAELAISKEKVQAPVVSDFTPQMLNRAEIEIGSVFSGIVSSLVSNLLTQNPAMVRRTMNLKRAAAAQARSEL